jgi:hypothetical protein
MISRSSTSAAVIKKTKSKTPANIRRQNPAG